MFTKMQIELGRKSLFSEYKCTGTRNCLKKIIIKWDLNKKETNLSLLLMTVLSLYRCLIQVKPGINTSQMFSQLTEGKSMDVY